MGERDHCCNRQRQVVTKDSATIDGKPAIAVDAGHRNLQRCDDCFTGNYLQIVHQINLIMEYLNKRSQLHSTSSTDED